MVTVVVSPMPRRLSATTMVAVGSAVSMAKLLESVVPTPLLPAVGHAGVVQGDQVGGVGDVAGRREGRRPGDAAVAAADVAQVPLAMVRSALSKPLTASLKVMVTSEVADLERGVRDHDGGGRHLCRWRSWPSWWCRAGVAGQVVMPVLFRTIRLVASLTPIG
jgi:hypothetical protein